MTLQEAILSVRFGTKHRAELSMRVKNIEKAVTELVWMARRYAHGRSTYAPGLFNDAYDVLRTQFGDAIDPKASLDMQNVKYYDVTLSHTDKHPYAEHGREDSQENKEIRNRKFYEA